MLRRSTRITILASLCLLVLGASSSLGGVASANSKDGCEREHEEAQQAALTAQLIDLRRSVSVGTRCENEQGSNACIINIGNTQRVGGKVQSTTSITCNRDVPLIHVQSWVTRTKADGTVADVDSDSSTCLSENHCDATASLDWVSAPNDLWHGWGMGRVEYDNQGEQQDKCQFRGGLSYFGQSGLFRSNECRKHNRCMAVLS